MRGKIAPSVMCVDFMRLAEALKDFAALGIEYLHVDIMDGCFVPNYTLGPDFCRALKEHSRIPLDIHLMITQPERKLDWFPFGEGDYVSVHYEATPHPIRAPCKPSAPGRKAMLALNPATPWGAGKLPGRPGRGAAHDGEPGLRGAEVDPRTLDKIAETRAFLDARGFARVEIEVDGNVSFENALKMREKGPISSWRAPAASFTREEAWQTTPKSFGRPSDEGCKRVSDSRAEQVRCSPRRP